MNCRKIKGKDVNKESIAWNVFLRHLSKKNERQKDGGCMDAWMDEWMKVSSKVGSYVSTQRGRVIWGQILISHTGLWSACAAFKCQIRSFFYTSFEAELLLHNLVLQISDANLRIVCIEHVMRL